MSREGFVQDLIKAGVREAVRSAPHEVELGGVMVLLDSRGLQKEKSGEQREKGFVLSSNKTQIKSKASSVRGLERSL